MLIWGPGMYGVVNGCLEQGLTFLPAPSVPLYVWLIHFCLVVVSETTLLESWTDIGERAADATQEARGGRVPELLEIPDLHHAGTDGCRSRLASGLFNPKIEGS